ncbi:hypothetical protein [Sulfitobacter sp. M22]|uniref:hypothetical protein n=1 Tax=Sulfitobacter sp. M22 TaxID=2675332 RepID=UPI001F26F5A0|nr:hypothetical protein [Sulfitobacter sp. M22]MCF7728141.1 hypothetical protein [Sulfitobacter sp. M22]
MGMTEKMTENLTKMDTVALLLHRRSERGFLPDAVPVADIGRILRLARAAPRRGQSATRSVPCADRCAAGGPGHRAA